VFVFVEDAAESVASSDVEVVDLLRLGGWSRRWLEGAGVGDALVGSVGVVVFLELPQPARRGRKPFVSMLEAWW
jgi:hypothetical protein